MTIKELKKGEFFKLSETGATVYVRDYYDRETKKYWCYKYDDVNAGRLMAGTKSIYTDFIF